MEPGTRRCGAESKIIPVILEREISAKSENNIISAVKKVSPAVVSISGVVRRKVQSLTDFTRITKGIKKAARVTLLIKRRGYTMYLSLYEKRFR